MTGPRVGFVSLSDEVWGAETTLKLLVSELIELQSLRCDLMAPEGALSAWWVERGLGDWIELRRKRRPHSTGDFARESKRVFAEVREKLGHHAWVHSHHQWTHLPVALATRHRAVLDIHDIPRTAGGRAMQSLAAGLAGKTFTASSTVSESVSRPGVEVLPRPVNGTTITKSRPDRSGEYLRIAIVARADPWKGVKPAVECISRYMGEGDQLMVIGGNAEEYGLPQGADDQRVIFIPKADHGEVMRLLHAADVLFLSAEKEPFGRVVVEAAAVGVPSIVFSGSGAAASVKNTNSGVVIETLEQLPMALDSMRRETVPRNSLASLASRHDPTRVAGLYLDGLHRAGIVF